MSLEFGVDNEVQIPGSQPSALGKDTNRIPLVTAPQEQNTCSAPRGSGTEIKSPSPGTSASVCWVSAGLLHYALSLIPCRLQTVDSTQNIVATG